MLYSPLAFAAVRWMPTTMLCCLAFLVSALAAICFRKPVVAMTVATVAFIGALMVYVPAVHYGMERSRQLGLWLDYESLTSGPTVVAASHAGSAGCHFPTHGGGSYTTDFTYPYILW